MRKVLAKPRVSAAIGMLVLVGGVSGCSMFSPSNAPVDCDAVLNQEQAGFTDAKIASDLGASLDKVEACHGPKTNR